MSISGPEKRFETALIRGLRDKGAFAHHVDMVACDGFPDILCLWKGRCILIECKCEEKLSKTQLAFASTLVANNQFWGFYVARYDGVSSYQLSVVTMRREDFGQSEDCSSISELIELIFETEELV